MQRKRAKFQNKFNQLQLYNLANIIMVKIKLFNPGSSDTIISEKVAEYSHPILSVVVNSYSCW